MTTALLEQVRLATERQSAEADSSYRAMVRQAANGEVDVETVVAFLRKEGIGFSQWRKDIDAYIVRRELKAAAAPLAERELHLTYIRSQLAPLVEEEKRLVAEVEAAKKATEQLVRECTDTALLARKAAVEGRLADAREAITWIQRLGQSDEVNRLLDQARQTEAAAVDELAETIASIVAQS
jgi:hypothetical protein